MAKCRTCECCEVCRFWKITPGAGARVALCRKKPPELLCGEGIWPKTQSSDWCGAFEKKEKAE